MLYVGLDVHSRQSSLCILNAGGGTVKQIELKGPRSTVVDRLRQLEEPFSICYEASCGYGHLYEQLRPLAAHVAVAHPGKLRLIYGSKRKNDRVDAQKYAGRHPAVALLMTIPGVGIRTAETFVAWVDDIARFRNNRQIGSYFGLVPCQDASADKNRLGHITRDGPPVMRKLICEAT